MRPRYHRPAKSGGRPAMTDATEEGTPPDTCPAGARRKTPPPAPPAPPGTARARPYGDNGEPFSAPVATKGFGFSIGPYQITFSWSPHTTRLGVAVRNALRQWFLGRRTPD